MGIRVNNNGFEYAEKELLKFISCYEVPEHFDNKTVTLSVEDTTEDFCFGVRPGDNGIIIYGGSRSAVLCGVYKALEAGGIRFGLGEQVRPETFDFEAFFGLNVFVHPKVRNRGIRQHINFTMDISSYALAEAEEYIRDLARLKFNAITFHSYNTMWTNCEENGYIGRFFYNIENTVPKVDLANPVNNKKYYCIPEIEDVFEDDAKRSEAAHNWLSEVMKTAKECMMKVTLSVEIPFTSDGSDKEKYVSFLRRTCSDYPMIDVLELISHETGGSCGDRFDEKEGTKWAVDLLSDKILSDNGKPEYIGEKYSNDLCDELDHLKRHLIAYSLKDEWAKGLEKVPEIRMGFYSVIGDTNKILRPIHNKVVPEGVKKCWLPAHSSMYVADALKSAGFNDKDFADTMIYSWAEFDGSMYVTQVETKGIEKLISLSKTRDMYGICLNHWRNAENRLTIEYASEAFIRPVSEVKYFFEFAEKYGIRRKAEFASAMNRLSILDLFTRDELFNVGFCHLGCWTPWQGVSYATRFDEKKLVWAGNEFKELSESFGKLVNDDNLKSGNNFLTLMENRCKTSFIHIQCFRSLYPVKDMKPTDDPEEREIIKNAFAKARQYALEYLYTYSELMPDRGAEGLVTSYNQVVLNYLDIKEEYYLGKETENQKSEDEEPPLPV